MKKSIATAVAAAAAVGAASSSLPAPYKDGCSGGISWFYRNVLGKVPRWEHCCDAHDRLYGPGGSPNDKLAADLGLYKCVARSEGTVVASLYFVGVTIGGQPFFPMGWRWGYELDYALANAYYFRGGPE